MLHGIKSIIEKVATEKADSTIKYYQLFLLQYIVIRSEIIVFVKA